MIDRLPADIMAFIVQQQELMFNEHDFQIQLALSRREAGHDGQVSKVAHHRGLKTSTAVRVRRQLQGGLATY